jgi:hypothetical protein
MTPPLSAGAIRRLRAMEQAATPAPWVAKDNEVLVCDDPDAPRGYPTHSRVAQGSPPGGQDADLIAESRNHLRALLEVAEAVARWGKARRDVANTEFAFGNSVYGSVTWLQRAEANANHRWQELQALALALAAEDE